LNTTGTKTTTGDLKPQTLLNLKVVATSSDSVKTNPSVEDEFTLTMRVSVCVDNKIAFDPSGSNTYAGANSGGAVASDITYVIGESAQNITPKYSTVKSFTPCPITAELLVLNDTTNQWEDDSTSTFTNNWVNDFKTARGSGF